MSSLIKEKTHGKSEGTAKIYSQAGKLSMPHLLVKHDKLIPYERLPRTKPELTENN